MLFLRLKLGRRAAGFDRQSIKLLLITVGIVLLVTHLLLGYADRMSAAFAPDPAASTPAAR